MYLIFINKAVLVKVQQLLFRRVSAYCIFKGSDINSGARRNSVLSSNESPARFHLVNTFDRENHWERSRTRRNSALSFNESPV